MFARPQRAYLLLVGLTFAACASPREMLDASLPNLSDMQQRDVQADRSLPDADADARDRPDRSIDAPDVGAPDLAMDAGDAGLDLATPDGAMDMGARVDSGTAPDAGDSGPMDGGPMDAGADAPSDAGGADASLDAGSDASLCEDVVCDRPPSITCASGTVLRRFSSPGTCAGGSCTYPSVDTPCADATPPAPACVGPLGGSSQTFAASGTCFAAACRFSSTTSPCPFGCEDGTCREECTTVWDDPSSVDTNVQASSAAALDAAGAGIAYTSRTGALLYGERDGASAWTSTNVAEGVRAANGSALAVDAASGVHVLFLTEELELTYAYRAPDAGTWTREVVDARDVCAFSLVLDAVGSPHIAYSVQVPVVDSMGGPEIWYGVRGALGWDTQSLASVARFTGCGPNDLALDGAGDPHVLFSTQHSPPSIVHAELDSGVWTLTTLAEARPFADVSVGVDGRERVHALYTDGSDRLQYARRDAGTWSEMAISASRANGSDLELDEGGRAHIAFVDGARLRYTFLDADGLAIPSLVALGRGPDVEFRAPRLRSGGARIFLAYTRVLGSELQVLEGALCPFD